MCSIVSTRLDATWPIASDPTSRRQMRRGLAQKVEKRLLCAWRVLALHLRCSWHRLRRWWIWHCSRARSQGQQAVLVQVGNDAAGAEGELDQRAHLQHLPRGSRVWQNHSQGARQAHQPSKEQGSKPWLAGAGAQSLVVVKLLADGFRLGTSELGRYRFELCLTTQTIVMSSKVFGP